MRARLGIIAVALALPGAALAQGNRSMRFAELDRNHDGVITRAEWRGNDRSFEVNDWNGDGILSGDEVRPDARRPDEAQNHRYDNNRQDNNREFDDWTAHGFYALDRNHDYRITRDEWNYDRDEFRRADHNGDGVVSRAEFLNTDERADNRDDRYRDYRDGRWHDLDDNHDNGIDRSEWTGNPRLFAALDDNRDGRISGMEITNDPPPELFNIVDENHNGIIERNEWAWSGSRFETRDVNRDGRLTRDEFERIGVGRSPAYRSGYDRGMAEGRAAGREDHDRRQGWDLDGQRELESADSGYEPRMGSREEYQEGYRAAFRRGYREGYGPRS